MGHGGAYVSEVERDVEARRRAVVDAPWTWLRQVHGDTVITVTVPGAGAGSTADASVTDEAGAILAVLTAERRPALDLPTAVASALKQVGVTRFDDVGVCTACSDDYFSWRGRGELARQAMVVWRD